MGGEISTSKWNDKSLNADTYSEEFTLSCKVHV